MARIRTTRVQGSNYLQAVRDITVNGQRKLQVLASFGQDTPENRLRALQFVNSYNSMEQFFQEMPRFPPPDPSNLLNMALAVSGVILGLAVIKSLIEELFS